MQKTKLLEELANMIVRDGTDNVSEIVRLQTELFGKIEQLKDLIHDYNTRRIAIKTNVLNNLRDTGL